MLIAPTLAYMMLIPVASLFSVYTLIELIETFKKP